MKMCGRCYDEVEETFPANCAEKPEMLKGQPIGQYHCPDCGAMVMAGLPHSELCKRCLDRRHPGFDLNDYIILNWLQEHCMSLISDDQGHWACTCEGMQNLPDPAPGDVETTFFIKKAKWKKSIREAICAAIEENHDTTPLH